MMLLERQPYFFYGYAQISIFNCVRQLLKLKFHPQLLNIAMIESQMMIQYDKELSEYSQPLQKQLNTFKKIFADKPNWPLHSKKWQRLNCSQVFESAANIHAKQLNLYSNAEPNIIKPLVHAYFPNLTQLNLKNNKIESVQILCRLNMPMLSYLNLSDNQINQIISALFRTRFAQLNEIVLYSNNIREGWERTKSSTFVVGEKMGKKCKKLVLGINYMTDMRWVNKLQNPEDYEFISIQNNRGRQRSDIKRWAVDSENILM